MSDRQDTLQQYISDMLAVEKHIHEAVRRQEKDDKVTSLPRASSLVSRIEETLDNHIAALENHLEQSGGDAAAPVKDAVTSALGVAAGLYDKVRDEKVSKMLRDNYTALSLAAISYEMLHTTGLALNDQATADLALRHLKNWTPLIMQLSEVTPEVVARELQDDGFGVDSSVAAEARRMTQKAWQVETAG